MQHVKWKRGGVEEGRGGEKLEEEVFYRGKSGKHFPLFCKGGWKLEERESDVTLALLNFKHVGRSGMAPCSC